MFFLIGLLVVVVLFNLPNPNRIGDESKTHFAPAHKGSGTRFLFQAEARPEKRPVGLSADGGDRAHFGGE